MDFQIALPGARLPAALDVLFHWFDPYGALCYKTQNRNSRLILTMNDRFLTSEKPGDRVSRSSL